MSEELKLCPFCGKPFRILGDEEWGSWCYAHDSDCILASEPGDTHQVWLEEQDVIDALNRRPTQEAKNE